MRMSRRLSVLWAFALLVLATAQVVAQGQDGRRSRHRLGRQVLDIDRASLLYVMEKADQ